MTPSVIADSIVNLCGARRPCVAMFALLSPRSRKPADPAAAVPARRGRCAVLHARRRLVERQRVARSPVADPGGIGAARRAHRHRRHFAASCAARGQDRGGGRRRAARPWRRASGWRVTPRLTRSCWRYSSSRALPTCAWLLATRDRSALLASENRSIGRLAAGALIVIPFIVTDFQALAPDMPVRLGALGALLVVTAVLIAAAAARRSVRAS